MILGGIASVLAAAWKFLGIGQPEVREGPLDTLYALARRIRGVATEAELSNIEDEIDNILREQRLKLEEGDEEGVEEGSMRPHLMWLPTNWKVLFPTAWLVLEPQTLELF